MLPADVTMCFTGPRPNGLHGYREADRHWYRGIVDCVYRNVKIASEDGITQFISGGAQGFDQLAFWGVHKAKESGLDVRNTLYLPFRGQSKIWPLNGMFGQREYAKMQVMSDEMVYTTDSELTERQNILKALYHRNHCMVDSSRIVLALLTKKNANWENGKGGTAECIRYAVSRGKHVIAIRYNTSTGDLSDMEIIN